MPLPDAGITAALFLGVAGFGVLAALALRPTSFALLAVAGYVIGVAEVTALVTVLSPFALVTRGGLAVGESVALLGAAGVWSWRGRPALPRLPALRPSRSSGAIALAVLGAAVALSVVYQLILVGSAPPNNWDSLTYHLARSAAWARHGGMFWIPNAPTDRLNEFQPLAEQQVLGLLVASGGVALFALPQLLAELACGAAVFLIARRIGESRGPAAFAACFFLALPLVALEGSTAQNDLVAAAMPAAGAALALGGPAEVVLGGVALGLGLGVKLTTIVVLPAVCLLAALHGRKTLLRLLAGAAISFATLASSGYLLNLVHTGHVLGRGGGRVEEQASPSVVGALTTLVRLLYKFLDLAAFSGALVFGALVVGLLGGGTVALVLLKRGSEQRALLRAGGAFAVPFLAPCLVLLLARVVQFGATKLSVPVFDLRYSTGGFFWQVSSRANEDLSYFGPLGAPLLISLSVGALLAARDSDRRRFVLGLALPLYLVFLAVASKYNPWLGRFLIVPLALAAPLAARCFRWRWAVMPLALLVSVELASVHVVSQLKPIGHGVEPWRASWADGLARTFRPGFAATDPALERALRGVRCVGASAIGSDDPSLLLYGHRLARDVTFLVADPVARAEALHLPAVVIGTPGGAAVFRRGGWTVTRLSVGAPGRTWSLAWPPKGAPSTC